MKKKSRIGIMNLKPRNTVRGTIPASEIGAAYGEAFNQPSAGGLCIQKLARWIKRRIVIGASLTCPFHFADQYYQEVNETLVNLILGEDKTNLEKYVPEDFDCDDFAFRLMGIFHQNLETAAMPIFITWVSMPEGGHAVLSYYIAGEVKIIEPQNDQVYSVPANWGLLLLCG